MKPERSLLLLNRLRNRKQQPLRRNQLELKNRSCSIFRGLISIWDVRQLKRRVPVQRKPGLPRRVKVLLFRLSLGYPVRVGQY